MSALARRGPSIEVHVTKESFGSGEMGKVMSGGFIYVFVLAILLSLLLCGLAKAFERGICRVQFCAFLGLIVALGDLAQAIWMAPRVGLDARRRVLRSRALYHRRPRPQKIRRPQSRTVHGLNTPHNSARSTFRPKNPRIARNSLARHVSTSSCATSFAPP